MTEQPTNPNFIKDPFKTEIDVTDDTPISEYPEGYAAGMKQRLLDAVEETRRLQQGIENFSKNPDIEELLLDQVHQNVSRLDDHIIKAVFHVCLSAYMKPLNLGLKCESGSGKTYGTTETVKFLPPEDIQNIGSQSPKVLSHENGIRKSVNGEILDDSKAPKKPDKDEYPDTIELKQERAKYAEARLIWKEKLDHSYYEVDLRNKIIVYLESVNIETFKMLKATMSHDAPYIDHKYVDDKGKVHVTRLVGAPALIFNSVDNEYVEEFATRNLTATPKTTQEKIEAAMRISNLKSCYPWIYEKEVFNKKLIQEYIRKIKFYLEKGKINVANPFDGIDKGFSKDATRDMRDFNKFLELLPSYAIFKLFQRPIMTIAGHRYLIPTVQDALDAKETFDNIIETTRTGTDARIIEFYCKYVANKVNGSDAETLTDLYNKDRKHKLSVTRIRAYLIRLEQLNWVDIREAKDVNSKGYVDRRYNSYFPLKDITPNALITAISVDLEPILKEAFETWLKNTLTETDPPTQIIILNIDGTATEITLEEMKELIIKKGEGNNKECILNQDIPSESNNKGKNTLIPEKNVIGVISNPEKTFNTYLPAKKIRRTPGVTCNNYGCTLEAEYDLNGNLYCVTHFGDQKKFCEDNGTGLKSTETEAP